MNTHARGTPKTLRSAVLNGRMEAAMNPMLDGNKIIEAHIVDFIRNKLGAFALVDEKADTAFEILEALGAGHGGQKS